MPGEPAAPTPIPAPFRPATPVVIGIVGGIAAGKSAVAKAFSAHGLRHIDADAEARTATGQTDVLAKLVAEFGPGVAGPAGLDRAALASLVFADPAARQRLEAIVHPPIRAAILAALDTARSAGQSVLLDAPLLLEGGLVAHCDRVVFVQASDANRAARAASRGWSSDELGRREAAQTSLEQKRARADFLIDNDGSLATMQVQVAAILERLRPSAP